MLLGRDLLSRFLMDYDGNFNMVTLAYCPALLRQFFFNAPFRHYPARAALKAATLCQSIGIRTGKDDAIDPTSRPMLHCFRRCLVLLYHFSADQFQLLDHVHSNDLRPYYRRWWW
jgi:hypothetical protein